MTLEVADDLELLDSLLNRHLVRLSLSWATGKTSVSAAQSVDLDISKDGVDSSIWVDTREFDALLVVGKEHLQAIVPLELRDWNVELRHDHLHDLVGFLVDN